MDLDRYKTLTLTRDGRILTIAIDNGPMNAVDDDLHRELGHVFVDAQDDVDSDLVVLTGAGRAFCAGGDMAWFQDMIDDTSRFRGILPDARRIIMTLLDLEKPIVCRLNGAAAGLGASLALLCDVIVADENAKIGDPHVKVGLVAGDGGAVIWPQLIGYARAKEWLLTGDMMTAAEAARMGLINHAVPAEELDAKVDGDRGTHPRESPVGGALDEDGREPASAGDREPRLRRRPRLRGAVERDAGPTGSRERVRRAAQAGVRWGVTPQTTG